MFRFLLRLTGFLLIAGAIVVLVVDGTRSIVNAGLVYTPLGEILFRAFPRTFVMIEPAVTRHLHPALWDPVLLNLFLAPAFVVSLILGVVLLWLGQKPREPIGYLAGR